MRGSSQESATPYCRCRVLYLGSSVPHASKEGLLGVQEPLRELYPEQGALGARGIDSWLSVWSNGLLLENVDEHRKKVTRFFPIESLHYCAAVRHVKSGSSDSSNARFLPLDSPFARNPSANHPPLFAAVLRRTTGIKVLECHAFICKRDMAANALVRCCFHAYADSSYAKGLEPNAASIMTNGASPGPHPTNGTSNGSLYHTLGGSSTTLDNNSPPGTRLDTASNDDISLYNGDENHKVWAKGRDEVDAVYQEQGTLRSTRGSRPRQLIAPPPPPPPPPPPSQSLIPEESTSSTKRKTNKKLKKIKNRHEEQMMQHHHPQMHPQAIYTNGHGHHTLGHPIRQQHFHQMPPQSRSVAGTLARPAPVLLVPAATLPRKAHHHPRGMRPIPAAAPIVPVYAPLPVVPPPPGALYQPTYGTAGNRGRRSQPHPPEQEPSSLAASRRLAASHADLTADGAGESPEGDSRFGTGIYRRKGHLNERAFSYSIRAEHRSRSHGSLASLGFSPQNGTGKEEKKDREIAQMVAGLSLDDHERGQYGRANHHGPLPIPRPRR
uniref:PID domain-containing protein n=1 Tax=Bracon brevicornis TaxID=1563983 RepID=A0A6V7J8K9_9HYME